MCPEFLQKAALVDYHLPSPYVTCFRASTMAAGAGHLPRWGAYVRGAGGSAPRADRIA